MKIRQNFKIAKNKIYYCGLNDFYKSPFVIVKRFPQNAKKDKDRIKKSKKSIDDKIFYISLKDLF